MRQRQTGTRHRTGHLTGCHQSQWCSALQTAHVFTQRTNSFLGAAGAGPLETSVHQLRESPSQQSRCFGRRKPRNAQLGSLAKPQRLLAASASAKRIRTKANPCSWYTALAWLTLIALSLGGKALFAQTNEQEETDRYVTTVRLTLDPAAESQPALKNQLLATDSQRKPGNAATYYYRAMLQHASKRRALEEPYAEHRYQWHQGPLIELPSEQLRDWLQSHEAIFRALETAAYREYCDWDHRFDERSSTDVFDFTLPEIDQARSLARMLQLKARLEIAQGRYEDALHTLRIGFQLARDVSKGEPLFTDLIANSIVGTMEAQLREFIGAAESPNLYWALTALPDPLIDIREGVRFDMQMPLKAFPFLADAETAERCPEQWRQLVTELVQGLHQKNAFTSDWSHAETPVQYELMTTTLVMQIYPTAKQSLIQHGYTSEQVKDMPAAQVVAIHSARVYQNASQDLLKWTYLPYSQARERLHATVEDLREQGHMARTRGPLKALPLSNLSPSPESVLDSTMRVQQRMAALRAIEAIRIHAADHDGTLPRSLEAITAVPVPRDPATDQPFPYRLEGETAVLEIPPTRGFAYRRGYHYVISIKAANAKEK